MKGVTVEHSEREKLTGHSVFSPSQLYRIMACPASVTESTYAPIQEQSSYARRGTELHAIVPDAYANGRAWLKKQQIPNNLTLDEFNWLNDCLDYIEMIMKTCSDNTDISFELEVDLTSWGLPEVWGTADVNIMDHQRSVIHVIDWKFGSGVQVFVKDNEQLLAYGAGSSKYPSSFQKIIMHVVQPPLSHFDEWGITIGELQNWVFKVLSPAIERAKEDDAPYGPGEKQCRFCPAGMTCRARHKKMMDGAKEIFKTYSNLTQVTKEELSSALRSASEYEKYIKEIKLYALNELLHGREFPQYKLVAGRSTRKWKDSEADTIVWLQSHSAIKDKDLFTRKLISPTQAEKLDKSLKKDDSFKEIVHKPEGKPQLAPADDKRPALSPTKDATSAFEDYGD